MPGEPFADFRPCGIGVAHEQPLGGHDEARRAEPALHARIGDEGLLQGMEVLRGTNPLDGFHARVCPYMLHLFDAGPRHLPVQQKRAGAALPRAAADFRPGESEAADDVGKGILFRIAEDVPVDAVDIQGDTLNGHVSSEGKGEDRTRRIAPCPSHNEERRAIRLADGPAGPEGASGPRNP